MDYRGLRTPIQLLLAYLLWTDEYGNVGNGKSIGWTINYSKRMHDYIRIKQLVTAD